MTEQNATETRSGIAPLDAKRPAGNMISLTARDLLSVNLLRVPAGSKPADYRQAVEANPTLTFAVFDGEAFLGLVGPAAVRRDQRTFADLCYVLPSHAIPASTPLEEVLSEMDRLGTNTLAVAEGSGDFLGIVTRTGINKQLASQADRRRLAAESLADIGRLISGSLDPEEVAQQIVEGLRALLHVKTSCLFRLEPESGELAAVAISGNEASIDGPRPTFPRRTGVSCLAVSERRPVTSPDVLTDPGMILTPELQAYVEQMEYRAVLEVPLIVKDCVVGALGVGDRAGRVFDNVDIRITQAFADQAAIALDNARLYAETRQRLKETETLLAVGQIFTGHLPTEEAMRRVAREVGRAFQADMVGAYFLDARKQALVPVAGHHVPKDLLKTFIDSPLPISSSRFIQEAWETRKPVWSSDAMSDPRFSHGLLTAICPRATLLAPTMVGGEIVGGLFLVWWTPGRTFLPAELRLIGGVASQVGLALENADLTQQTYARLQETELRATRLRTLTRLNQLVTSSLTVAEVLGGIAKAAAELMDALVVSFWIIDEDTKTLEVRAFSDEAAGVDFPVRKMSFDEGAVGWIAKHRQPLNVPDVFADGRFLALDWWKAHDLSSFFGLPVLQEGNLFAVLALNGRKPFCVGPDEQDLLESFAAQAAVAIRNAHLYQESESRRMRLATLVQVSQRLNRGLDLPSVLNFIAEAAAMVFEGEAGFRLVDGEFLVRVGATPGAQKAMASDRIRIGESLSGRVAASGQPLITSDSAADTRILPQHRAAIEPDRTGALMCVPMKVGEHILGTLHIFRERGHVFDEDALNLAKSLANHAVIAIDNARLFGELRAALEEIETTQQQVVQGQRLKALGEMAGGVAHDFNNALAVILGRTRLLLEQTPDSEVQRQLQVIEKAASDAAQTVRRIQEFTRIKPTRPFQSVDLNCIVEEVIELTRSRWKDEAQAFGVAYDIRVETSPVPPVAGDPSELREALTNLLFNALDAMPQGGQVTFQIGGENGCVHCIVSDTGIGMTEEVRQRVFDPFFTTKGPRGTGLGLSVVYGIVARHKGNIEVETEVGKGSAFAIRLPICFKVPDATLSLPSAPPARSARILVIDDEPEIREVLSDLLTRQGHAVATSADGKSGVTRLQDRSFDLVITDLAMSGQTGWQVASSVKLSNPEVPVIMLTGYGDQIDPKEARARGVNFLLSKPFALEDISTVVAQALARRDTDQG